jgi:hypothetical protein
MYIYTTFTDIAIDIRYSLYIYLFLSSIYLSIIYLSISLISLSMELAHMIIEMEKCKDLQSSVGKLENQTNILAQI